MHLHPAPSARPLWRLLWLVGALLMAGAPLQPSLAAQPEPFVVIVHPTNPSTAATRQELSRLFLKATPRWSDGTNVTPIDQPVDAEVRQVFSMRVHQRRARSIENYWREQIFSGKGVPPLRRKSDDKVVELVRRIRGSIGYVSVGTAVDGVKILEITD